MNILEFPAMRQTYEFDCGAKALQSVLAYYGIYTREELLLKHAKTSIDDGTSIDQMCRVITSHKLSHTSRTMELHECTNFIDQKIPVIILLQAWSYQDIDYATTYENGHWVVLIGYDTERVIFEDPYAFYRTYLTHAEFVRRWHGQENDKPILHHGIAVFGKEPNYDPDRMICMK
jgi:predicted double-glycine peptidase